MGRRGDKRRARDKRRRTRNPDIESFSLGPLTVERHGRDVIHRIDPEHPDYGAYLQATDEELRKLPGRIEAKRDELGRMFAPFDAFDLLADLWLANVPKNVETYRESEDRGLAPVVELAAAILVERQSRAGTERDSWPAKVLEAANEGLRELLELTGFHYLAEADARAGDNSAYGQIRGLARLSRLAVRGPSYPWQERRTLKDLFGADDVRGIIETAIGFSIEDGLAASDAAERLGLDRYHRRIVNARESAERLKSQVARARAGQPVDVSVASIVRSLDALTPRQAAERIDRFALIGLTVGSGETMQFTAQELASEAKIDERTAIAFLDLFSVQFGEFADRDWPPGIEDLRYTPIVQDGEGHFLCVSPSNLFWGLRPVIEEKIKQLDRRQFQRWERHRSKVVERRAVAALRDALRADWAEEDLLYDLVEEGQVKTAEVDGLVKADTALVFVEAKASSMRKSARRAAPEAFRTWLAKAVGTAARQARRARDAFLAPVAPHVRDRHGTSKRLDLGEIRHAFEVVVVLEDLTGVAPATWQLADAGVLPKDPTPWVVNLHDLELICELAEWPAQLLHYLLRRRRLDAQRRAWAQDELDFFMHYLTEGLYWPDTQERGEPSDRTSDAPVNLLSFTDRLDAYFAHREGERRKPANRPRRRVHRDVRAVLELFDGLDAVGSIDVQLVLLDIDHSAAKRVATGLRRLKERTRRDDAAHDETLVFDDYGITVMALPEREAHELERKLHAYSVMKKYQMKLDRWLGFGCVPGGTSPAEAAIVLDSPWRPDPAMDRLVSQLPSASTTDHDFDGRRQVAEKIRERRRRS